MGQQQASNGFWGTDETSSRAALWNAAAAEAGPDGWIYIFDADHLLQDVTPQDVRRLCQTDVLNAWAFPLYDLWADEQHAREDEFWQAHYHPRPWLVKAVPFEGYVPEWQPKSIHCGHIPHNYPIRAGDASSLAAIHHLGYIQEAHRKQKHDKYLALEGTLTDFERAHAASITDEHPRLIRLPDLKVPKILLGIPVRKPPEVIEALLQTIRWQQTRSPVQLDPYFILNYPVGDPAQAAVRSLLEGQRYVVAQSPSGDYSDGVSNRQWTEPAFHRMGRLKDGIIDLALAEDYDYLWFLDADVLCDPYTLQSLLDSAQHTRWLRNQRVTQPIVAGVYWTDWQRVVEGPRQHVGPQVWLQHPYVLQDPYKDEARFRRELIGRQRINVLGLGACTLIPRAALEKGVRFAPLPDLPRGGMWQGEDRHFCVRANRLHLPLVADAWPDIYHAYHPQEYGDIPAMMARLGRPHADPQYGHLISALVETLDPVGDDRGQFQRLGEFFVRGRLGALGIMPQMEEALGGMSAGDSRLVRVHHGADDPIPQLRLRTILKRVTLFDSKPFCLPPVIDREVFVGGASGALIDHTQHTTAQLEEIASGD